MKIWITAFLIGICTLHLQGQTITISGHIDDKETGEKLIGASVFDVVSGKGTSANSYGFYSLTLPQNDSILLRFSFIGMESVFIPIDPKGDVEMNISMGGSSGEELEAVVVTAKQNIQEKTEMSTIDIPIQKIKSLPVLLGEKDVLKTIQLLPGVQSGSEGTSGIYVRGGGPDQNLILLDGVPVYNASHLFGFFSVFNPDALNNVKLVKGGFPARYGGRLSSVIDISMKEGNMKKFHGEGSIGIISSKLALEGPIKKDKTSFLISGRRTYIDLLTKPIIKATTDGVNAGYFFHDVNAKINHKFSDKSRLYFSTYVGQDKAYSGYEDEQTTNGTIYNYKEDASLAWGNVISALRWNKIINKKLFSNTTLTYSQYRFNIGLDYEESQTQNGSTSSENFNFDYTSGIYDWSGKIDFDYLPNPNHYIRFGAGDIYHTFTPGVQAFKASSDDSNNIDTTFGASKIYAHELYAYIEDDYKVNNSIKINAGVHASSFWVNDKKYYSIQPRLSGRVLLDESSSIKASYSSMTQYIHLLTNPSIGLPTDLWVPVTDTIRPQFSHQFALGYARTLPWDLDFSAEVYYKTMDNLIAYKDGTSFLTDASDWQNKVEMGTGESYGLELLLEKKVGKTSGWIGYTLSWANRQFENINFGEKFPYKFDRRHDISIALTHKFSDKIDVGMVWVYGTGNAITLATEKYLGTDLNGNWTEIEHFERRNNFRSPAYHRLDLGVNIHKEKKWGEATWSIGVYNAYNRQNPFYLYFGYNNDNDKVLKQVSLFPVIPSISYAFKF